MEINKDVVLKVLKGAFVERDATVVDRYFSPDYVQHNPDVMQEKVPASATASGNPMFTPA